MLGAGLGLRPALAVFRSHARNKSLQVVECRLPGGRQSRKQEVESMHGPREFDVHHRYPCGSQRMVEAVGRRDRYDPIMLALEKERGRAGGAYVTDRRGKVIHIGRIIRLPDM